jgi:hypothetical protein
MREPVASLLEDAEPVRNTTDNDRSEEGFEISRRDLLKST